MIEINIDEKFGSICLRKIEIFIILNIIYCNRKSCQVRIMIVI